MADFFKFGKDRSSSKLHIEATSSSVENAATAYQTPSLLAVGAQAKDIACLCALTNLLLSFLLLKIPSLIKKADSLKRTVVILSFANVCGWLPLMLVSLLVRDISPTLLITLWIINLIPGFLTSPLVDKWLSDLVPPSRIGRYLSIRAILSTATYISFFFIMGNLLDYYRGANSNGFSIIYITGLIAGSGSFLLYLLLRVAVPLGETPATQFGLIGFICESKQNNLGTFILYTAFMMFAASISTTFFSVYMLRDLHFSYLIYALVLSVEVLARIIASFFGGKWIDQAGAIRALRYASLILPLNPILWLFSQNIGYLMFVQVLSGISWAIYDLSTQSFLCQDSPQGKRLHYILYHRSIITFASSVGPLTGSFLLTRIYPIFDNPILSIFLISGILRLLIVVIFLPRLKNSATYTSSTEANFPMMAASSLKPPLYITQPYRSNNLFKPGAKLIKRKMEPVSKAGSFYHPELWEWGLRKPINEKTENIRQDLLYRSNIHNQVKISTQNSKKTSAKILRPIKGLSSNITTSGMRMDRVTCA